MKKITGILYALIAVLACIGSYAVCMEKNNIKILNTSGENHWSKKLITELEKTYGKNVDATKSRIDFYSWMLTNESIKDALLKAARNGVPVRCITTKGGLSQLGRKPKKKQKINTKLDNKSFYSSMNTSVLNKSYLPHDKTVLWAYVVDGKPVYGYKTGSANNTNNGSYHNTESVEINSDAPVDVWGAIKRQFDDIVKIAVPLKNYLEGQETVVSTPQRHNKIIKQTPKNPTFLGSLDFNLLESVCRRIEKTTQGSITLSSCTWNYKKLKKLLAGKTNVERVLILDKEALKNKVSREQLKELMNSGVKIHMFTKNKGKTLHHSKLVLIDRNDGEQPIVITMSKNLNTASKSKKDVDGLIVRCDSKLYETYMKQVEKDLSSGDYTLLAEKNFDELVKKFALKKKRKKTEVRDLFNIKKF